jgi:hypothetical protein
LKVDWNQKTGFGKRTNRRYHFDIFCVNFFLIQRESTKSQKSLGNHFVKIIKK